MQNMQLAERLGAETATIGGDDIAEEIVSYARSQNVTKIVIGQDRRAAVEAILRGTVVDEVLERSGEIDVYVVQGGRAEQALPPAAPPAV